MTQLRTVLRVALLAAVATLSAGAAMKDPFAGVWKITATPDGAGKEFTDSLSFKGGQFTPAELVKKGWAPAAYEDDVRQGGIAQYTSTIKHPKDGEMKWTGVITASEIRGNITWKKPDGDELRFSYTGTKL